MRPCGCEIDVLLQCALSNQYHSCITIASGVAATRSSSSIYKLLARSQDGLRGRGELMGVREVCVVKIVDREAVLDKLDHKEANPVRLTSSSAFPTGRGVNGSCC